MDKISKTFCGAKWNNATIWLDWGKTTSCHHPPPSDIIVKDILKNPAAIHNTIEKKEDRQKMLAGERPSGCEYCWKIEDMGPEYVSDRIFKTNIYQEEQLEKISREDPFNDFELKTLEISFDRKCNFACSYCNGKFSTSWLNDIKRFGPYTDLQDAYAGNYESRHEFLYEDSPINPYLMAFWKWWPKLSESLQELRITGGEPLLSQDFWELIRFLSKSKRCEMHFAVNSNLGASDIYIDRLIEASHKVSNFHLYTSCESMGAHAEYVRDGLDFERFKRNLEKTIELGRFSSVNIMMTINALCMFSITEFLNLILDWKVKYGASRPAFSLNMLRFPSFMSVLTLPDHLKETAKQDLNKWLKANRTNPLLHQHEIDSIKRLIDYLHKVQQAHKTASTVEIAQRDLRVFYDQYDKRRIKSILKTFPKEFTDWYLSIPADR